MESKITMKLAFISFFFFLMESTAAISQTGQPDQTNTDLTVAAPPIITPPIIAPLFLAIGFTMTIPGVCLILSTITTERRVKIAACAGVTLITLGHWTNFICNSCRASGAECKGC